VDQLEKFTVFSSIPDRGYRHPIFRITVLRVALLLCAVVSWQRTFSLSLVSMLRTLSAILFYHYSVRLSICHAVVLYLTEFISSNFVHRDIGAYHSFFQSQSHFTKFQREYGIPVNGGVRYLGAGKLCDFRSESPFISETV